MSGFDLVRASLLSRPAGPPGTLIDAEKSFQAIKDLAGPYLAEDKVRDSVLAIALAVRPDFPQPDPGLGVDKDLLDAVQGHAELLDKTAKFGHRLDNPQAGGGGPVGETAYDALLDKRPALILEEAAIRSLFADTNANPYDRNDRLKKYLEAPASNQKLAELIKDIPPPTGEILVLVPKSESLLKDVELAQVLNRLQKEYGSKLVYGRVVVLDKNGKSAPWPVKQGEKLNNADAFKDDEVVLAMNAAIGEDKKAVRPGFEGFATLIVWRSDVLPEDDDNAPPGLSIPDERSPMFSVYFASQGPSAKLASWFGRHKVTFFKSPDKIEDLWLELEIRLGKPSQGGPGKRPLPPLR